MCYPFSMEISVENLRITFYETAVNNKQDILAKELKKDIRRFYDARQRERYAKFERYPRKKRVHKPKLDIENIVVLEGASPPLLSSKKDDNLKT